MLIFKNSYCLVRKKIFDIQRYKKFDNEMKKVAIFPNGGSYPVCDIRLLRPPQNSVMTF